MKFSWVFMKSASPILHTFVFSQQIFLKSFILDLKEIHLLGVAVMHANRLTGRQTEGHDEVNSRFSLLWESV